MKINIKIVSIVLSVFVVVGALGLAAFLVGTLPYLMDGTSYSAGIPSVQPQIMDKFDMFITNEISDALDGILSIDKVYWLSDDDLVAPEPDQSCYGETSDPAVLRKLMDDAAKLLGGQTCYFHPDVELRPDSTVQYYLDDTIFVVTWKEVHDNSVYTFSEIKIAHPSQFRRFLAGGEYGSGMQAVTTEMAASVNAVVASSGDYYGFRTIGTTVYDGKVQRVGGDVLDTCMIDKNGDLLFCYAGGFTDLDQAQYYVDKNNIRFNLAFGPIIVDDGKLRDPVHYSIGEVNDRYSRSALCQMDKLHYLLCTANYEGDYRNTPTMWQFGTVLHATGCDKAYALDGGQTAAITMNDQLINTVSYGSQRWISDIIYFATAVPKGD